MKRKNQNKCYRAHVVTLVIVFKNIYQIFRPVTLPKHMLITNQYFTTNYYLINSVINTFTTLLRRIFNTTRIQGLKTLIQCEDLQFSFFIKLRKKMFPVTRNLFKSSCRIL